MVAMLWLTAHNTTTTIFPLIEFFVINFDALVRIKFLLMAA